MKSKINSKELKAGIYQIRNLVNDKVYIGSSQDLHWRKYQHFQLLKNGKHHSKHLQRAFDKHGIDNFEFEVLSYCNVENLLIEEGKILKSIPDEDFYTLTYNICKKAVKGFTGVHSEESKAKSSQNNPNRKPVITFDNFGKELCRYSSAQELADKFNKGRSQIGETCYSNSKWSISLNCFIIFESELEKFQQYLSTINLPFKYEIYNKNKKGRPLYKKSRGVPIRVTNLSDNTYKDFEYQSDAEEYTGVLKSNLNRTLKNGGIHKRKNLKIEYLTETKPSLKKKEL